MESMQLVNYVRAEVKSGNQKPDVSSKSHFEDEKYLKPTLEDDALLYSLDDDLEEDDESPSSDPATRAAALEEELARLRVQFEEYRQAVQKSMGEKLNGMEDEPSKEETKQQEEKTYKQNESGYFTSYAYNGKCTEGMALIITVVDKGAQRSMSLCSKTKSVPMPIATSSMTTSTCSKTR